MLSRTRTLLTALVPTALVAATLSVTGPAAALPVPDPTGPTTPAEPAPADLTLATFNVLGSSHTRGPGGKASGPDRMGGVVRSLDEHDVEVVGFQELQADQLRSFRQRTEGRYEVWPGSAMRELDGENSLAWEDRTFEAVEKDTVAIPYFHGRTREMPVVKLRHRASGRVAWFANFHNPSSKTSRGNQDGWRRKALDKEIALAERLHRDGTPVLFTGDYNDRERAFCPMTVRAPMQAARGGSNDGTCKAGNPRYVDWLFGSTDLEFDGYVEDRTPIQRRVSDHPVIVAETRL